MVSKWYELKAKAVTLRKKGKSIRYIETQLGIPRSTLSGWFKDIALSDEQIKKLEGNRINHLHKARKLAVLWHNQQKENRIIEAQNQALNSLSKINHNDLLIQELALAMLYLGEGTKTSSGLGMGNSDPLIIKFFIKLLSKNYSIKKKQIRCWLHLRADQDPIQMKSYWSKELKLPLSNFKAVSLDQRTLGKPTYPTYNGVCVVGCGNIATQRKLVFMARKFCETIIS